MNMTKIGFETWLESSANFEKQKKVGDFSLKTISLLANHLDNPQDAFSSVHIAGSKGKGSVASMIASILRCAGIKEGLYTSPHLTSIFERVSSANGPLPDAVYEASAEKLIAVVEDLRDEMSEHGIEDASWFELMTLFAFLCFKNSGKTYAVVETGLGGRFDATNILQPVASVITHIEKEHTEYLGDTLAKIAFEKAGIIKEHTPCVTACQNDEVLAVLKNVAKQKNAPLFVLDDFLKDLSISYQKNGIFLTINFGKSKLHPFAKTLFARPLCTRLKLFGEVQARNAALASLVVKLIEPKITENIIELGLSLATLPCRFDLRHYEKSTQDTQNGTDKNVSLSDKNGAPGSLSDTAMSLSGLTRQSTKDGFTLILDGAHTVSSVKVTLDTYKSVFGSKACIVLFACSKDKNMQDIAKLFAPFAPCIHHLYLTRPGKQKQADMAALCKNFLPILSQNAICHTVDEDYAKIITQCIESAKQSHLPLFVLGSFYLASEVLQILTQKYSAYHLVGAKN